MILPFFSSIFKFLSFPPFELSYLIFISLIPLFIFLLKEKQIWKIICGILLYRALSQVLLGLYIPEPIFIFFETLFFIPFIILIITIKRIIPSSKLFLPIVAAGYLLSECVAARYTPLPSFVTLSGLPLPDTAFISIASWGGTILGGPYTATIFVIFVNLLLTLVIARTIKEPFLSKQNWPSFFKQLSFTLILILAIGFFSNAMFKNKIELAKTNNVVKKHLRLAMVSTGDAHNDASGLFFPAPKTHEEIKNYINKNLKEVQDRTATFQPDLLIMPEHFFDMMLIGDTNKEANEKFGITNAGIIFSSYQSYAKVNNVAILVSLKTYGEQRGKKQSMILIDANGNLSQIADKYYLTIVSERWPLGKWLPFYWKWALPMLPPQLREESFITLSPSGQYSSAEKPFSIINFGNITLGPLLCSEGHYNAPYQSLLEKGTDIFISTSDNGWLSYFKDQYIKEMILLKQLYAVSSGKPILVSGLKDSVGIIYPNGKFEGLLPKKTDNIMVLTKDLEL